VIGDPDLISELWRRLKGDRRGVSAVEFALIAPALIACYFGLAEMCGALMAERKASHIASAIGDLVAQATTIHDSDMTDIWTVSNTLMTPLSSTSLKMRVTSIIADSTGKTTIAWTNSPAAWSPAISAGQPITVPTGIVAAGGSVIRSEASYTYSSPVSDFIPVPLTFNEVFYLAPRQSTSVARVSP
jgi:Flp pilus assembly protein TadG